MPWKIQELNQKGDAELVQVENKFAKYLERMFEIVQVKSKKYAAMSEDGIFKELDKVIACQLKLEAPNECKALENNLNFQQIPLSNIPLVDIVIQIDLFTAHFEDRSKVLRIIKELYNHCTTMKKLLLKHGKMVLPILLTKYDK